MQQISHKSESESRLDREIDRIQMSPSDRAQAKAQMLRAQFIADLLVKAFMKKPLLYGSTLIALGASPAGSAGEITPPVGNYTGVREQSMVIYPHPADLALASSEDRRLYDHPAVVIAKTARKSSPVVHLHPALWR
jgi:hypothetical protein